MEIKIKFNHLIYCLCNNFVYKDERLFLNMCYDPLAMKVVDTSFFCILTNHSYIGHVKDSYIKDNSMSSYSAILLFNYLVI